MVSEQLTVQLGRGRALQLSTQAAQQLLVQLQELLEPEQQIEPLEVLAEEHPMWEHHSVGSRHDRPQWTMDDLHEARLTLRNLSPKARVFFDILLEEPGRLLTSTEIMERAPDVFASASAIAGALNGFTAHADRADRPLPFYWWAGPPSRYAVRTAVADVFLRARPG